MNPFSLKPSGPFGVFAGGICVTLVIITCVMVSALVMLLSVKTLLASDEIHNPHSIESAIKALKDGNNRFASGNPTNPNQTQEARTQTATHGQTPLAAVLACSDSRVPVEELFDMGIGDLFVIKAAGAVPGVDQVGSIEYAVAHLGVPVVLVLSHTSCGAITAAVNESPEEGALGELLKKISPISAAVKELDSGKRLDTAIKLSAIVFREELPLISPVLNRAVRDGKLAIISGVYDISSGLVNIDASRWDAPPPNDSPLPPADVSGHNSPSASGPPVAATVNPSSVEPPSNQAFSPNSQASTGSATDNTVTPSTVDTSSPFSSNGGGSSNH
ncbi:MAG: hypothetical protein LBE31_07380 [Deltaproteobacteria bacterium]|jgi:carbonic anhydrase|nr:hypothetical protein [Deltaproteobacteria bacterium]